MRDSAPIVAAVTLLLAVTGCGDDSGDARSAGADTSEYCAVVAEINADRDLPGRDQLDRYRDLAPDEIQPSIDVAYPAMLEASESGDAASALSDPAVSEAIDTIVRFEEQTCGTQQASDVEADSAGSPVEVVATDYAFEGIPTHVAAGTELVLRNGSAAEVHELVAFDLPPDERRSAAELIALPADEFEVITRNRPNLVLVAEPGESSFVVVGHGTLERSARYLVFCSVPTGADPAEFARQARESSGGPPDVPGGAPHFTQGMFAELSVP